MIYNLAADNDRSSKLVQEVIAKLESDTGIDNYKEHDLKLLRRALQVDPSMALKAAEQLGYIK